MFCRALGLAVALAFILAAPRATHSEAGTQPYQIGVVLHGGAYQAAIEGLREGLRGAGPEEGRHWSLVVRETKGDLSAVEEAVRELARQRVDLQSRSGSSTA